MFLFHHSITTYAAINTDIGVSPKTWDTLLKALSEVDNLTRATEEIKEHLKQCCEICSFD